jgi:hypothetical protein
MLDILPDIWCLIVWTREPHFLYIVIYLNILMITEDGCASNFGDNGFLIGESDLIWAK